MSWGIQAEIKESEILYWSRTGRLVAEEITQSKHSVTRESQTVL